MPMLLRTFSTYMMKVNTQADFSHSRCCGLLPTPYGDYPSTPEYMSRGLLPHLRTLPIARPAFREESEEVVRTIIRRDCALERTERVCG
ncbi:hypothetical protein NDU88_002574 [Pleurodeles waltl]|uniref:Uncharacterized protein n=1 Tax=Pleurodeles waltl TaxID=8319 RepID=A0AAV7W3Q5_PLEWA|nr:hypothetical protein NDU88_002574 [Pleurodeles waltl]